jgi:hypothetical protein
MVMSTIMKQTKRSLEVVVAANQIDLRTLNCKYMTAMTVPQKSTLSFIQNQLLKKIIRFQNLNNQKSTFLATMLTLK